MTFTLPDTNLPQQDRSSGDPLLRVARAAGTAQNPRGLWQEAARILAGVADSPYVSIEYTDLVACGRVEWGVKGSGSESTFAARGDGCRVDIRFAVAETELPRDEIESVVRTVCTLAVLVGRRMALEHERRLGSFIAELSRWVAASNTEPAVLMRYTLESIVQLVGGSGALVVYADPDCVDLEVVASAGSMKDAPAALLDLIRPAVAQVVGRAAPLLIDGSLEPGDGALSQNPAAAISGAMFVPLRATDRVAGALCVARAPASPDGSTPFTLNDMSYVDAVASHIAGGLEVARAIAKAKDAAARASAMVHRTPFPLVLLSLEGTVLQVNEAFLELCGRPADSLLGVPVTVSGLTVKGGSWPDALEAAQSGMPWRSRVEVAKGGEVRYCEATVTPLEESANGDILVALHDRTDELRAQRELVTRERLSAVGEMASGVAHEVNNPLATIKLEAELLGGATTDPETAKTVQTILREVDRAAQIARGLLCLSRQSMVARQEMNVNDLVQSVIDVRSRVASSRGVRLFAELSPDVPNIVANGGDLQQVLVNLITNAEQAVLSNSQKCIRVSTELAGEIIRLTVADSGSGVDPALRAKIFDPFFTTKDPDTGTGLGLALSQRVVMDHGGCIRVEDSDLGGAAFVVELPTGRQTSVPPAPDFH